MIAYKANVGEIPCAQDICNKWRKVFDSCAVVTLFSRNKLSALTGYVALWADDDWLDDKTVPFSLGT